MSQDDDGFCTGCRQPVEACGCYDARVHDNRAASVEVETRLRAMLDDRNQLLQAAVMILDDEELQSRLLRDDAALCRNLVRRINDLDKGPVR